MALKAPSPPPSQPLQRSQKGESLKGNQEPKGSLRKGPLQACLGGSGLVQTALPPPNTLNGTDIVTVQESPEIPCSPILANGP